MGKALLFGFVVALGIGIYLSAHFDERYLLTCQLTTEETSCRREVFKEKDTYSINQMIARHQKALAEFQAVRGSSICRREDLSDRLEMRLLTYCLDARKSIVFMYKTIWPTDFRALNYYRKRDLDIMARKMDELAAIRNRNGGQMPKSSIRKNK